LESELLCSLVRWRTAVCHQAICRTARPTSLIPSNPGELKPNIIALYPPPEREGFTANWIKAQIARARLEENRDFLKVAQKGELSNTGQVRIEYHLTTDAAKQIAMMSGGDKAFEVRDYFLACERKALAKPVAQDNMAILSDPSALRMALLEYTEKVITLENKVVEQKAIVDAQAPKVEALNRIAISDGSFSLREAAKVLQIKEKEFLQFLHSKSWTYRMATGQRWMAHATILRQGYMEHKTTTGEKDDGTQWTSSQAKITPRGIAKLALMLGIDLSQNDSQFSQVA